MSKPRTPLKMSDLWPERATPEPTNPEHDIDLARADTLAAILRALWPDVAWCRARESDATTIAALVADGAIDDTQAALLREVLGDA